MSGGEKFPNRYYQNRVLDRLRETNLKHARARIIGELAIEYMSDSEADTVDLALDELEQDPSRTDKEIAVKRISDALKQPDMFIDSPKPLKQEEFGI
jgi:hypothetical protein